MDILYQAIIENQKMRIDLLKWKLILSAALASVGFGTIAMPHSLPRLDVVLRLPPGVRQPVKTLFAVR
jgi:hypothetical protein